VRSSGGSEADLAKAMLADRHRLRRQLRAIRADGDAGKPVQRRLQRWRDELARSIALVDARRKAVPPLRYPQDLPICANRDPIAAAIREHPVVIVCGETGSGKSTQLPKICLELGRGIEGMIGHTQPRRIAARSVAARVAEELGSPLGQAVGFKIRFAEAVRPTTLVKVMTDGMLLAECQADPFLEQYDTIILDEAHERSLNIDFLLGYVKRLLPKRRGLKLIITSATIDAARFADHFRSPRGPAPVIEVSGRSYPVEIRWRPLVPDEEGRESDLEDALGDAVDELARIDSGDILLFMPTERDIHELAKALRGRLLPGDRPGRATEILPLYARLSIQEQQRIFQPHGHRRIVIATNVAESSLTVPGIRYVIDPGTARISRYSARTRTQRLPIEPISRASADQRAGRCGRVAPGICIRLYDEEDFLSRERFTPPEIQRSNLASVILQTKAMRLGEIERFPFLDPPRAEAIREGYATLAELAALDERRELTEIGRQLSRLPVDPRIGRMILAARDENCLSEVLVIAAALELQDPRERPLEKQQAADACHAQFADADSDFLGYLKLWDFYHRLKGQLSRSQLRKACRQNFLSHNRMREWVDIHLQLLGLVAEAGMRPGPRRDQYDPIHRAVLTGLLSSVAVRGEGPQYTVAGNRKALLWPGSGVCGAKPAWVVGAEVVETANRYLRCCARIDPRWIESLAGHLVHRSYSDVGWDRTSASATALERVSLFGLTIVSGRRVRYGPIDPAASRELLIRQGLVEGQIDLPLEFHEHNRRLVEELERLQAKLRRNDLLLPEWRRFEFYDERIPADAYDGPRLVQWLDAARRDQPRVLHMSKSDLIGEQCSEVACADFPDAIPVAGQPMPLEYRFEPGAEDDGITLTVPVEALNQVDRQGLDWLVPGLLEQKLTALIRALPKELRRNLAPAAEHARQAAAMIRFGKGDLLAAAAAALGRLSGQRIPPQAFRAEKLPPELRMNLRVVDQGGQLLASGRDADEVCRRLGQETAATIAALDDPQWNRDGLRAWDFGDLPEVVEIRRGGLVVQAHPMLVDRQESLALRLAESPERAERETRRALERLFFFAAARELKTQAQWLPSRDTMELHARLLPGFVFAQHVAELMAARAVAPAGAIPRSKGEFDRFVSAGRERIGLAVQEVSKLLGPLLEAHHQARLALQQHRSPRWQYALDDIRAQLDRLAPAGFLTSTPWQWLVHYPRFFRAIPIRLEALRSGGLARDRQHCDEIAQRWRAFAERADEQARLGVEDPVLMHHQWMLEEYRVSLFAQRLGTSIPVSAKRLDQHWATIARR